jgi:hypothetical protein
MNEFILFSSQTFPLIKKFQFEDGRTAKMAQEIPILTISVSIHAVFQYRQCKCLVFTYRMTLKVGETLFRSCFQILLLLL